MIRTIAGAIKIPTTKVINEKIIMFVSPTPGGCLASRYPGALHPALLTNYFHGLPQTYLLTPNNP